MQKGTGSLENTRIFRSVAALILISLFGKAIGLVRELVIANSFGTSAALDSFLIAYSIPETLSMMVMFVALHLFVPIYAQENQRDPESGKRLAGAVFVNTSVVLVGFAIGIAVLAAPLITLLAPELRGATRSTAIWSLQLLSLVIVFRGLEGFLRGVVNSHRHFAIPMLGALMVSLSIIACVVLFARRNGVISLTVGTVVGTGLSLVFVFPIALRYVRGPNLVPSARHHLGRVLLGRLPYLIAIEATWLLYTILDRSLASRFLSDGSIAALAFARILYDMPFDTVVLALSFVLFPELSKLIAKGDLEQYGSLARRGVRIVVLTMTPISLLLIVLCRPVVTAVFQRGAFDGEATGLTSAALWAYACGLPFLGVSALLIHAAYARHLIAVLLRVRLLALAAKVILSLILIRPLGHVGLALSTSVSLVVFTVVLIRPVLGGWGGCVPRLRTLGTSTGMALLTALAASWVLERGFGTAPDSILSQAIAWTLASVVYVIYCWAFRVDEIRWLGEVLLRVVRTGKRRET